MENKRLNNEMKIHKYQNECQNEKYKDFYNDIWIYKSINSGRIDRFFSGLSNFMEEARGDIASAIYLFENGFWLGGFSYLYTAISTLKIVMFIFDNDDEGKRKELVSLMLDPNNDFKKSGINIENIIFKEGLEASFLFRMFKSISEKQSKSVNIINKYRHKESIKYYENFQYYNTTSNYDEWVNCMIEDSYSAIDFSISLFLLTWIAMDRSLPIFTLSEIEQRYPDSVQCFPIPENASKYLPELTEEFIKESELTKDIYSNLFSSKKPMTNEHILLVNYIVSKDLSKDNFMVEYASENDKLVFQIKEKESCFFEYDILFIEDSLLSYSINTEKAITLLNLGFPIYSKGELREGTKEYFSENHLDYKEGSINGKKYLMAKKKNA